MKRSKFSDQQIAFLLRQGEEGASVEEVCRKAGIPIQTYYRWRKKYGGLMPSEMKRLKQLEEENQRLKRLVADLSLDKEMLQEVVRKSSEACQASGVDRRSATGVAGERAARLRGAGGRAIHLPIPISPPATGRTEKAHRGDRADPCSLWLPPHPRAA